MSAEQPRPPASLRAAVAADRARRALVAPVRLWRRSLRVRTVAITLLLSSVALLAVGTVVSYTIAQGLFQDRLQQVESLSLQAHDAAQAVTSGGSADLPDAVQLQAINTVKQVANPTGYYWLNDTVPGRPTVLTAESPAGIQNVVSSQLQASLKNGSGQHWQSVAVQTDDRQTHPAIVVGDTLRFNGGTTELYLIYDIHDVQETLIVVQRSLLIGFLALLVLIGGVATVVSNLVVAPLKQAAATSELLADGHLERRIPEHGEDVVATLARSFNRMAENLQRQITQLANLSRVQQRFVSDVSHELRTPLTTIRLASDVIYDARDRFDAPSARSAELLKTQVERFEVLLADLLEISRMDAHAADVSGEPTNLVDLVREGIDALGGLAEETRTEIRLHTPGGHAPVDVDARRIARIIRNLLANALEHGEGRPIDVTVDSSETAVAVGVRDHGIGMSAQDAERVFDRFWRADPSRQRRIGGTGLGLAISLEDATLHGGRLEVWSRRGEGTNFVLTLPWGQEDVAVDAPVPLVPWDAAPEEARPQRPHRRPLRIGS
ncbi:MtrAB system histidine kinase MtrB [Amnibacterium kyonggiense]|uniref:Sensor histidine kinase MtrB n=1 Tax=Amnibacterium kyonggiense TaxID=595671 RepID=A0A4R7FHP9_9MICO|nr:MtrAB system histidine kinase MtrB [Amnibacterium kyonggiense]TDS74817.1 two-component system sensor histidine kinase MtrB [Amnibacterium kyonggiense]